MTPELVQALGQYIVIPICGVICVAVSLYYISKQ